MLFSLGTKIVAFLTHVRAQTVNYTALAFLSIGGVPGAVAGVLASAWLHAHVPLAQVNHILTLALAVALLAAAAAVAFARTPAKNATVAEVPARIPPVPLIVIGLIVGTLVSITSIGSGSLTLPMLLLVLSSAQLRRLVGTDVAFAVVMLIPAILGHWRIGDVNFKLAGLLLVGSIPGVIVGAPLAARVPERVFRVGLATILLAVGLRLFF